ncbi:MAG: beta-lactamase family protein [Actinobacteria bacterium]|nr:beta-lactamase family protein [Actinomycetota bacterium]
MLVFDVRPVVVDDESVGTLAVAREMVIEGVDQRVSVTGVRARDGSEREPLAFESGCLQDRGCPCARVEVVADCGREAVLEQLLDDAAVLPVAPQPAGESSPALIARNDRVLFSHTYGLADRKQRIPNTLQTRFRIGSMNKMFTAVAILQLVEAGKVKLTAPVGTYLPGYPNQQVATKVTIHQLLTHTGGTGDIFGPSFDAHRKELRTLADYVSLYGKRGLEFAPGSQWAYSNCGFILLGVVIERVT